MLLGIGEHAVGELLGVHRGEGREVQRAQLAVDADLGRRVGGDVEVGATHLRHRLEKLMKAYRHAVPLACFDLRGGTSRADRVGVSSPPETSFNLRGGTSRIPPTGARDPL